MSLLSHPARRRASINRNKKIQAPVQPQVEMLEHRRLFAAFGTGVTISTNGTTTVQAENFDTGADGAAYHDTDGVNQGGLNYRPGTGVDIEKNNDGGVANVVDYIRKGEFLNYTVDVAADGNYSIDYRIASKGTGGTFHLEVDNAVVGNEINVPDTTGFATWASVNQTAIPLTAGTHVLKIAFDSVGALGFVGNLNSFTFTPVPFVPLPPPPPPPPPPVEAPFPGPSAFAISGNSTSLLEAENFDTGGEGLGYHDSDKVNQGDSTYRKADSPGVDISTLTDNGAGLGVTFIKAGENLKYGVSVGALGKYNIAFRVASAGAGGTFHVDMDGVTVIPSIKVLNTGGWSTYISTPVNGVSLTAGTHIMKIVFDSNGSTGFVGNLNYLTFAPTAPPAPVTPVGPSTPLGGTAPTIPAVGSLTIEAENYDNGGEGFAYHDVDPANLGGKGRTNEGVDVESNTDGGNGLDVAFTRASESMRYTVKVAADGRYSLDYRLASMGLGGKFHLELDGALLSGSVQVPDTTAWNSWSTINNGNVNLTAGTHVFRIVMDTDSATTGFVGNINWFRFTAV